MSNTIEDVQLKYSVQSSLRTTKKTFFSTYISIFIFSDNRGQNVRKHPWNFMFFSSPPLSPHLPPPQSCGEVLKQPERLSPPSTTLKQGEGGRKLHCLLLWYLPYYLLFCYLYLAKKQGHYIYWQWLLLYTSYSLWNDTAGYQESRKIKET